MWVLAIVIKGVQLIDSSVLCFSFSVPAIIKLNNQFSEEKKTGAGMVYMYTACTCKSSPPPFFSSGDGIIFRANL